jgi:hypothetical protein
MRIIYLLLAVLLVVSFATAQRNPIIQIGKNECLQIVRDISGKDSVILIINLLTANHRLYTFDRQYKKVRFNRNEFVREVYRSGSGKLERQR